jgi:hypothetical protein
VNEQRGPIVSKGSASARVARRVRPHRLDQTVITAFQVVVKHDADHQ